MKILNYLAIAALACTLAVACGKDNEKTNSLTETTYYDQEAQFTLPENSAGYDQVTFYGNGDCVLRRDTEIQPLSLQPRKRVPNYVYEVYQYTVNGNVYTIIGFGTITYDESAGTLTIAIQGGGDPIMIPNVTKAPVLNGVSALVKICRKWTVARIDINVKGGELATAGVGRIFDNGNLDEIAAYLKKNKVNFSEDITGYNITGITLGKTGSILVQFSDHKPYMGTWSLKDGAFSYEFNYNEGNQILNGEAAGTLAISNDKCIISLVGSIKGSANYTSTIEITLKPAK